MKKSAATIATMTIADERHVARSISHAAAQDRTHGPGPPPAAAATGYEWVTNDAHCYFGAGCSHGGRRCPLTASTPVASSVTRLLRRTVKESFG